LKMPSWESSIESWR